VAYAIGICLREHAYKVILIAELETRESLYLSGSRKAIAVTSSSGERGLEKTRSVRNEKTSSKTLRKEPLQNELSPKDSQKRLWVANRERGLRRRLIFKRILCGWGEHIERRK